MSADLRPLFALALAGLVGCPAPEPIATDAGADGGSIDAPAASDAPAPPDAPSGLDVPPADAPSLDAPAADAGSDAGALALDAGRDAGAPDAGVDAPICAAPAAVGYTGCVASSLAVRFTSGSAENVWWLGARSDVALPACGTAPTAGWQLVSAADRARGRVDLAGGPGLGECWVYRFCAEDTRCTSHWSAPTDVRFCVDASGTAPTCGPG